MKAFKVDLSRSLLMGISAGVSKLQSAGQVRPVIHFKFARSKLKKYTGIWPTHETWLSDIAYLSFNTRSRNSLCYSGFNRGLMYEASMYEKSCVSNFSRKRLDVQRLTWRGKVRISTQT